MLRHDPDIAICNDVLFSNIYLDHTKTKLIAYILFVRNFLPFLTLIQAQCLIKCYKEEELY
jgi:hypothetical protein